MRNRHIPRHSRRDRQTSASLPWPFLTRGLSPAPCPPEVTPPSSLPHAEHGAKNGARSTSMGPHGMWNKRKKKVKEPQIWATSEIHGLEVWAACPPPVRCGKGRQGTPSVPPTQERKKPVWREGRTRGKDQALPRSPAPTFPLHIPPSLVSPEGDVSPPSPSSPTNGSFPTAQGVPWQTDEELLT